MPAEFLCNLPKNLTTHLTHKLYSVFPYKEAVPDLVLPLLFSAHLKHFLKTGVYISERSKMR